LRDGDESGGYGDEGAKGATRGTVPKDVCVPLRVSGVGLPYGADEAHIAGTCAGAECVTLQHQSCGMRPRLARTPVVRSCAEGCGVALCGRVESRGRTARSSCRTKAAF